MNPSFIPGTNPAKDKPRYTYKDYKKWGEDVRCELWYGEPVMMSPSPQRKHQELLGALYTQISKHIEGKPCKVYITPLDVFFVEGDESIEECELLVQPDLLVVCDPAKLIDEGIRGAPDFIVEVLSPHTAMRDQTDKKRLYEAKGVREYWIANPETLEVFRYLLENGRYGVARPALLSEGAESYTFPGMVLRFGR